MLFLIQWTFPNQILCICQLAALCPDADIYSGNDDQTLPMLSLGAVGVISVASNVLPREMSELCALWFAGKTREAEQMQIRLLDVMNALMSETNPIPVKAAAAMMGLCQNEVRLPLVPLSPGNEQKLKEEMRKAGLIC